MPRRARLAKLVGDEWYPDKWDMCPLTDEEQNTMLNHIPREFRVSPGKIDDKMVRRMIQQWNAESQLFNMLPPLSQDSALYWLQAWFFERRVIQDGVTVQREEVPPSPPPSWIVVPADRVPGPDSSSDQPEPQQDERDRKNPWDNYDKIWENQSDDHDGEGSSGNNTPREDNADISNFDYTAQTVEDGYHILYMMLDTNLPMAIRSKKQREFLEKELEEVYEIVEYHGDTHVREKTESLGDDWHTILGECLLDFSDIIRDEIQEFKFNPALKGMLRRYTDVITRCLQSDMDVTLDLVGMV